MRPARTSRRGTARAATRHIDPPVWGLFQGSYSMKRTFMRSVSWASSAALLLLAALLPAAAPAAAATKAIRISTFLQPPPPNEPPAFQMKDNAVQLSIDQAVEIALQRNLGIVISRYVRVEN